jgi:hypothetical protein
MPFAGIYTILMFVYLLPTRPIQNMSQFNPVYALTF